MDVSNAAASTRTHTQPYRFAATAILGVESYQSASVVPEWANVRRLSALVRALLTKVPDRESAGWEPWLSNVADHWPVALVLDSYAIRKGYEKYSYTVGRTFALEVFVEHRERARAIATECFEAGTETGVFETYTIEPVDPDPDRSDAIATTADSTT